MVVREIRHEVISSVPFLNLVPNLISNSYFRRNKIRTKCEEGTAKALSFMIDKAEAVNQVSKTTL